MTLSDIVVSIQSFGTKNEAQNSETKTHKKREEKLWKPDFSKMFNPLEERNVENWKTQNKFDLDGKTKGKDDEIDSQYCCGNPLDILWNYDTEFDERKRRQVELK